MLGVKKDGLAYWVACIRECFEEAGILLTNEDDPLLGDPKRLNYYRDKLNSHQIAFKEICCNEGLRLRANNIVPCAHWVTPTIEPKRFDTRFFLVKVILIFSERVINSSFSIERPFVNKIIGSFFL